MKLLLWLTVGLSIVSAQIGLQPPELRATEEIDGVREYWVYNYHIKWEGIEVLGDENILDVTYDLVRISLYVYSDCQPDSIISAHEIGDGIAEAMKIYWKKGYDMGVEEERITDWEKVLYGFCGAVIVGSVYLSIDMMGN